MSGLRDMPEPEAFDRVLREIMGASLGLADDAGVVLSVQALLEAVERNCPPGVDMLRHTRAALTALASLHVKATIADANAYHALIHAPRPQYEPERCDA